MNIINAINRLSYTTSNGHKCNDKDIDALNAVIDWINRQKEERLSYNHHFAKMVMFAYNNLLIFWKGNNDMAEREIQKILEQPLQWQYDNFRSHMHMYQLNDMFEFIDAKCTFWDSIENGTFNIDTVREEYEHNKGVFADPENKKIAVDTFKNFWEQDVVNKKLNHFITELLNKYENKEDDMDYLRKILNKK